MYYDHSKRSYYRFPSKNGVTDFDTPFSYYFPEKNSGTPNDYSSSYTDSNDQNEEAGKYQE